MNTCFEDRQLSRRAFAKNAFAMSIVANRVFGLNGDAIADTIPSKSSELSFPRRPSVNASESLRIEDFLLPTDPHWGYAINRAYRRATASGCGKITLPGGRFPAFAPDCSISPTSHVTLSGSGNTVLVPYRAPPDEAISAVEGVSDCNFLDFEINLEDIKSDAGKQTVAMSFRNTPRLLIDNVQLEGWSAIGLALNGVNTLSVSRLTTVLSKPNPIYGVGLNITRNGANLSSGMHFRDCVFQNAGVDVSGTDIVFQTCRASDYQYGAGFVSEVDEYCSDLTFIACVASGSRGKDSNGYACGGFEMWAPYTTMIGCRVHDVGGTGIEWASYGGILDDCIISDVGRSTGGSPAVSLRYGSGERGSWNASNSRIGRLIVRDSKGVFGSTTYAIEDQTNKCVGISIDATGLRFPLKIRALKILGDGYDIQTPKIHASTRIKKVKVGPKDTFKVTIPFPGVRPRDSITINTTTNIFIFSVSASVSEADKTEIYIYNFTSTAAVLAEQEIQISAEKPADYGFF